MKHELLLVARLPREAMEVLASEFTLYRLWESPDARALLARVGERVRGIVTSGTAGADAALMDALPALEIIACYGVGVDAIDLDHARKRGIAVTNTPDVLTDDVADMAMALMLDVARKVSEGDRFVRAGRWRQGGKMALGMGLSGKRLGILGLGRIGRAIARRTEAFGMRIAYHGRRRQPGVPYPFHPSPVALARDSDVLVIAASGGAGTRHLVDASVIDALGPRGVLVNIARGSLVDEDALVRALVDGRLGGAGLDVFVDEPNVPEALLGLDRVVLQPHRGSATEEARTAMFELVLANLRAHFAGHPVPTPVT